MGKSRCTSRSLPRPAYLPGSHPATGRRDPRPVAGHGWCMLSVVHDARVEAGGGQAACPESFNEMFMQVAGIFGNASVRRHGRWYLLGSLSHAERKNSWHLAEFAGDASPEGMQEPVSVGRAEVLELGRADLRIDPLLSLAVERGHRVRVSLDRVEPVLDALRDGVGVRMPALISSFGSSSLSLTSAFVLPRTLRRTCLPPLAHLRRAGA